MSTNLFFHLPNTPPRNTLSASPSYQLAVVNNGKIDKTCSNLQIGDSLCLGAAGSDCKNTHVVKAGDSCEAVASTYGVNATMFNINNPQLTPDCGNLYIGEVCPLFSPLCARSFLACFDCLAHAFRSLIVRISPPNSLPCSNP